MCEPSSHFLAADSWGNFSIINAPFGDNLPDGAFWDLSQGFSPSGAPLGALLVNKHHGRALHPNMVADPPLLGLIQTPVDRCDGWTTWTFSMWDYDQSCAIRPYADSDLNLNILGGCGGSVISLYGWDGGAPNELWSVLHRPEWGGTPSNYRVKSGCGGYLMYRASDDRVICADLNSKPQADADIWQVEIGFQRLADVPTDTVLINSGKALSFDSGANRLTLMAPPWTGVNSMFRFGQDVGGGYVAMQMGTTEQNLNVLGGCGNRDVGVWHWGGGDANEIWRFEPV
jgi:hypothetical protein